MAKIQTFTLCVLNLSCLRVLLWICFIIKINTVTFSTNLISYYFNIVLENFESYSKVKQYWESGVTVYWCNWFSNSFSKLPWDNLNLVCNTYENHQLIYKCLGFSNFLLVYWIDQGLFLLFLHQCFKAGLLNRVVKLLNKFKLF